MKFILILTMFTTQSAAINSIEFESEELCKKAAQEWLKIVNVAGYTHNRAICVKKRRKISHEL